MKSANRRFKVGDFARFREKALTMTVGTRDLLQVTGAHPKFALVDLVTVPGGVKYHSINELLLKRSARPAGKPSASFVLQKANKVFLSKVRPHVVLYRDSRTGIAWVEDGTAGIAYSCHPNISARGSVVGMKKRGFWRADDRTIRSHGFIYNIDSLKVANTLEQVACDACLCGGVHS